MSDVRAEYLTAAIKAAAMRSGADHIVAFLMVLHDQIGQPGIFGEAKNPYDTLAAEIARAYTHNRAEVSA